LNESKDPSLKNFKSIIFNNASMFFDQLVEIFAAKGLCSCPPKEEKKEIVCAKCLKSERKIAVVVLVRLGLDSPEPQLLAILN
jgi:hypothetical protein